MQFPSNYRQLIDDYPIYMKITIQLTANSFCFYGEQAEFEILLNISVARRSWVVTPFNFEMIDVNRGGKADVVISKRMPYSYLLHSHTRQCINEVLIAAQMHG